MDRRQRQTSIRDSANTGGGGGSNTGSGAPNTDRPRSCFNCGQTGHRIQECPAPPAPVPASRERPHGLDADTSTQVTGLITTYQGKMPAFSLIKMTDYHCIKLNNAIMAEYCHKCRRFNKKGPNMHHTATHVKRKGRGGTAPAAAPAPAPASANLGTTAPPATAPKQVGFANIASTSTNVCPPCAPAPAPHVPVSVAAPLIRSHTPAYDFGSMNSISQAQTTMYESDSDDEDGFLGLLIGDMLKG